MTIFTFIKIVLVFSVVHTVYCKITEEQMRTSGAMVRNVCQPKFKIPDDIAEGIRDGKFPTDKSGKCYIHCVMEMMGMMKKSKINYDAAIKQFDVLLPEDYREPFKNALTICKDSTGGVKDPCDAAINLIKCFSDNNPKFTFA